MSDLPNRTGWVTLRVPANAWRVLEETLSMDARSTVLDHALRAQVESALRRVKVVSSGQLVMPAVTTGDLDAVVDDLMDERPLDLDDRPYSRSQIEHALASWLGQLSEALLENPAHYARDGFQQPPMKLPPCSDLDPAEEARGERADRAYEQARERATA